MRLDQIFISYASEDLDRVRPIYVALKDAGYDPWLDKERLLPGENWHVEITKAIGESGFFLACFSRVANNKSGYVQRELRRGLEILEEQPEGRIYVVPVRLEPCDLPSQFRQLQWCDAFQEGGMKQILAAIARGIQERGYVCLSAEVLAGPDAGRGFKIFSPLLSIGRAPGNDICLSDSKVSMLHAKVELRRGGVTFRHLGEKTASVIKGEWGGLKLEQGKRESCPLTDGDLIVLGTTTLRISLKNVDRIEPIVTTDL